MLGPEGRTLSFWSGDGYKSIFTFFCLCHAAREILVPQPGVKPMPPAVEVQSLNLWTTREVPKSMFTLFKVQEMHVKHIWFTPSSASVLYFTIWKVKTLQNRIEMMTICRWYASISGKSKRIYFKMLQRVKKNALSWLDTESFRQMTN